MRKLVHEADPQVLEEWKWSTPVWSRDGILCTGESYRKAVALNVAGDGKAVAKKPKA